MPCGVYEVDEISYSAPPRVITIKAVSAKISQPLCTEKHNRAWENVKISTIANDIAFDNNLKLFYDVDEDIMLERKEQAELSDLDFIKQLCKDYGLQVKCNNDELIIYEREKYEKHDSVCEISSQDKHVISWQFKSKTAGTYKKSHVRYHNSKKNKTFEATSTDDNQEGSGRTLEINQRVESQKDAETLAKKKLHEANSKEITGTITLMGDLRFLAGVNITCKDFGTFDGKYMLESVSHKITQGYTCTLNLKMGAKSKTEARKRKKKRQSRKGKKQYLSLGYSPESESYGYGE